MNVMDLAYVAITIAFFCICGWGLSVVDERKTERNR